MRRHVENPVQAPRNCKDSLSIGFGAREFEKGGQSAVIQAVVLKTTYRVSFSDWQGAAGVTPHRLDGEPGLVFVRQNTRLGWVSCVLSVVLALAALPKHLALCEEHL